MSVNLLTEHHLEFLSLKRGCRSTHVNCHIVGNLMPRLINLIILWHCSKTKGKANNKIPSVYWRLFYIIYSTVVPTKSDSDKILCLQLLSKILTCILQLS